MIELLRARGLDARRVGDSVDVAMSMGRAAFVSADLRRQNIAVTSIDGGMRLPYADGEPDWLRALAPQLLCLDVDGCLIDVRESFDAVVDAVVGHFGGGGVDRHDILRLRAAGGYNDDNVLAQALLTERGKNVALDDIYPIFERYYFGTDEFEGYWRKERPLIRRELLERLRTQYHIALVTGRNRREVGLALPLLNLPEDTLCMTVDAVTKGKPDPEGIHKAMAHFGVTRAWMLGDNKDDVDAGLNAGVVAIGVSDENRTALTEAGAAVVLDNINQIEELL